MSSRISTTTRSKILKKSKLKKPQLRKKPQKKQDYKPKPIPRPTPKPDNSKQERNPDVIVDFDYTEEGLIFVVIENIGDAPAHDIVVKFNKKILGMQKTKNISALGIFQRLRFLPPQKKIKVLVDLYQYYILNKQPMQVKTTIYFSDKSKQKFQNSIQHDLSIYADLTQVNLMKNKVTQE